MSVLDYLREFAVVLLLIGANGLLSMLEMALVSSRRTRLEQQAEAGNGSAAYVLQLAKEPTEFLSTVQIGITLVGIGTGVYSGSALAAPLAAVLRHLPLLEAYASPIAYTLVVALVTYLSIILGELIPKRLAIGSPEKIVVAAAGLIKWLVLIFRPLTLLLSVSTKFLLKFIRTGDGGEPPVTEEEVKMMIEQGAASGVFNAEEQKIIENTLLLNDVRVGEIMTPRTKISWLDINRTRQETLARVAEQPFSCFVAADGSLDDVAGIIYTKKFLLDSEAGKEGGLRSFVSQPLYVPENMRLHKLLEQFRSERVKVALVMDEFGSLAGMITLRDVVEHLLGDVPSYDEEYEADIVKCEDGSWLVDGMMPLSEFAEYFNLRKSSGGALSGEYNTVAGLTVALMGRIPRAGDRTELASLILEVVDMDGKRVDKIAVRIK